MKLVLDGIRPWRHDLAGCLHACAATLLDHAGADPLQVLGAAWQFRYTDGDYRPEEYYFPVPDGSSLLAALAPYHPVGSRWHRPASAEQGWQEVRQQMIAGRPVAVAVDNFELPFRPAYSDVHSNHLVVVYGFDDGRGTVTVLDAVPPYFNGEIPLSRLTAARDSGNQIRHERDMFFADNPIGNRWLELVIGEAGPADPPAGYLARNLKQFQAECSDGEYLGRDGLQRFLLEQERRLAGGESVADELFVVAGVALATTAVHADWLAETGRRLDLPGWPELARQVSRVAHHWSAVRILAALSRPGAGLTGAAPSEPVSAGRLARRRQALLSDLDRALAEAESVIAAG
jgi:hypothetical protein